MSDDSEKTFAPTAKRKREAAQKGDVLRSRELAAAAAILFATAWLVFAGHWLMGRLGGLLRQALVFDRRDMDDFTPQRLLIEALIAAMPVILSLAVPLLVIGLVTQLALGEGRWVTANLAPRGTRIDPLAGLKRIFGGGGWIELGKGLLKVGLLGAIAYAWGRHWLATIAGMGGGSLARQAVAGGEALTSLLFALGAGLVAIALVDLPIQWLRRQRRLRMSLQDMRDENRDAEGSPEARAHRRRRQREIAAGGVAHAMRQAQFVVTNPQHFAVAMVYDPDRASAPLILARGRGDKAAAMKELAREYAVPLVEHPPLARAIYFTSRENQMVREELYAAIAAVLAFVLSLRRGEPRAFPRIEVPVALRFDADGRRVG